MHHKMQNGKEAPTALNRFDYMAPNILLLIYGHENLRCIEIKPVIKLNEIITDMLWSSPAYH